MKFKVGDRVVIVSGWFFDEYKKPVTGTWSTSAGRIDLDEPTKCHWQYKIVFALPQDCVPEAAFGSPLYEALK